MKVKLFSHVDLDGVFNVILAKKAYEDVDISYCEYNNIDKKIARFINDKLYKDFDIIYITDISCSKESADLLDTIETKKVLLDHHVTAEWMNKEYQWAHVEIERDKIGKLCGTWLLHEYLSKNEKNYPSERLKHAVEMVRRYDTWEWQSVYNDNLPKQFNDMFKILGKERFIEKYLVFFNISNVVWFSETDYLMLTLEQEKIDKYIKQKNIEMIKKKLEFNSKEYNVGIVFAENYLSELGNNLCEINPNIDFCVMINISKAMSFRHFGKNINLSEIASIFGGGGHMAASGAPVSDDIRDKIIKIIFEK